MSLRVGILGAGAMGLAHARAYQQAGVQVAGIFDVNVSSAKVLADKYGSRVAGSPEELIAGDIDALSICLPHHLHHAASLLAAQYGKHTLLEKPIDVSAKAGGEIVAAFRRADVNLMLGFVTRFYRSQIYLKQLIQDGYFGSIRLVVENLAAGGHSLPAWYAEKSQAGGGILLMGISHTVDRVGWLLEDTVKSVYAKNHHQTYQGNVEDVGSSVLEYTKGTLLSVSACRSSLREHERTHHCAIYGTEAEATIEFSKNHEQTLKILGRNGAETQVVSDDDPFRGMIEEFVLSIKEKRLPAPGGRDGQISLAVIEAMYRSADTGQAVNEFSFIEAERTNHE